MCQEDPIFRKSKGLTQHDCSKQFTALYTFLYNNTVLPNNFDLGKNCLDTHSTRLNGFSVLKDMLKYYVLPKFVLNLLFVQFYHVQKF